MTRSNRNEDGHPNLAEPLLIRQEEGDKTSDTEDQTQSIWLFCGSTLDYVLQVVVSVLLPALLTIQFRLAFSVDQPVHYPMVFLYAQILFFGIAGWLYRTSLTGAEDIVVQLWPEISTDAILLLVLYQQTSAAVFVLDVVSLALAIHAAWNYWDQLDLMRNHDSLSIEGQPSKRTPTENDEIMPLAVVV